MSRPRWWEYASWAALVGWAAMLFFGCAHAPPTPVYRAVETRVLPVRFLTPYLDGGAMYVCQSAARSPGLACINYGVFQREATRDAR